MKREAFKMFLKPGFEKEYEKRHAAIWPELKKDVIRRRSIRLLHLLGPRHQHPLCLPEDSGRRILAGYGS